MSLQMDANHVTFSNHKDVFSDLRKDDPPLWDIIIIGGGITGAGVLREAVRRGYRCLLLEQQDFSWGSSSRSSKMIHGGLRYLAAGDWRLTRESLSERERLLKELPGLVDRIDYYLTLKRGQRPGRLAVGLLLALYDWIAKITNRQFVVADALIAHFSGLTSTRLIGAYRYTDAMTDDCRLVLRLLQESMADGGYALNYTPVEDLLIENAMVTGVVLTDPETQAPLNVRAHVVVNATGAWADHLRNRVNPEKRIRPLRGSHLVIAAERAPVKDVLAFFHHQDNRGVYIYPWEGRTVIGTTDLDHNAPLHHEPCISQDEVEYLCAGFNSQFRDEPLKRSDIISTWAGVRPVIGADRTKNPSTERRDHAIWQDQGLVTVSGGKLTTFRPIALDIFKTIGQRLPAPSRQSLPPMFGVPNVAPDRLIPNAPAWGQILLGRYGPHAEKLVEIARDHELTPLSGSNFCLAECRWAARHESIQHLDDLLLRRTRLGLLLPDASAEIFPEIEKICSEELGWSLPQWTHERERYQAIYQRYYSLPTEFHDNAET